jgi:hypothetical protein
MLRHNEDAHHLTIHIDGLPIVQVTTPMSLAHIHWAYAKGYMWEKRLNAIERMFFAHLHPTAVQLVVDGIRPT